jgi:hypothetical protein
LNVAALKLNIVVEWLTLPLNTHEFPGSNLVPETGYPDSVFFCGFSPFPPGKCMDSTLKLGHDCFLLNPLQFIIHYHFIVGSYIVLVTEKVL